MGLLSRTARVRAIEKQCFLGFFCGRVLSQEMRVEVWDSNCVPTILRVLVKSVCTDYLKVRHVSQDLARKSSKPHILGHDHMCTYHIDLF